MSQGPRRSRMLVRRANVTHLPAPVGGWNRRDAEANMDKSDALEIRNWFPSSGSVDIRKGFKRHATGLSGRVQTMAEWAYGGQRKLLAFSGGNIYDASALAAVGAALATGKANDRWQTTNFGTTGGNFLIGVNGDNTPIKYNGTTVSDIGSGPESALTGTGLTPSNLIHVNAHKRRLFFLEKNTLNFWYLPVLSIGGTLSKFPLDSLCKLGGSLMAMTTWTIDGGTGIDDLAVFITSAGEVIVYQGLDPGTDWLLVGVYRIGKPLGRRCFEKRGGDVVVITEEGFFPLSRALITSGSTPQVAISDKISQAVKEAALTYGGNFGWQPLLYPGGGMLIFNVPTAELSAAEQYVMNTITGAWCRFTEQPANCWCLFKDRLFFGGNGIVYEANVGTADDGVGITADLKPAFVYPAGRGTQIEVTMVQPIVRAGSTISMQLGLNTDYADGPTTSTLTSEGESTGASWDTATWDVDSWASSQDRRVGWHSLPGIGRAISVRMKVTSALQSLSFMAMGVCYNPSGDVL